MSADETYFQGPEPNGDSDYYNPQAKPQPAPVFRRNHGVIIGKVSQRINRFSRTVLRARRIESTIEC
jgi:hypothetical protein